ncbi:MAG: hypothetical protein HOO85_03225, partial [Methylotenera sp.]|nr:hypothetical protein [Methylotenera sp.]
MKNTIKVVLYSALLSTMFTSLPKYANAGLGFGNVVNDVTEKVQAMDNKDKKKLGKAVDDAFETDGQITEAGEKEGGSSPSIVDTSSSDAVKTAVTANESKEPNTVINNVVTNPTLTTNIVN